MQVFLAILSAGLLGLIIFFAVSPKSSRLLKISALIALGLIGVAIGVCVFLLVKGPSQDPVAIALPVFQDMPTTPANKTNTPAVVIFVLILLVIMGLIILGVKRDQKRAKEQVPETKAAPVFNDDGDLGLDDEPLMKDSDDSFDIDI